RLGLLDPASGNWPAGPTVLELDGSHPGRRAGRPRHHGFQPALRHGLHRSAEQARAHATWCAGGHGRIVGPVVDRPERCAELRRAGRPRRPPARRRPEVSRAATRPPTFAYGERIVPNPYHVRLAISQYGDRFRAELFTEDLGDTDGELLPADWRDKFERWMTYLQGGGALAAGNEADIGAELFDWLLGGLTNRSKWVEITKRLERDPTRPL